MKNILTLVLLMVFSFNLLAQKTIQSKEKIEEETLIFKHKVKLLDDFLDRFNYKRTFDGERIKDVSNFNYDRAFMLKTLFDYDFYLNDSLFIQEFASDIVKENTYINFYETDWYSIVNATVSYSGIDYSIALKMQVESEKPDNRAKWVMKGVVAPFISMEKENSTKLLFIQPAAHETNFISLSEAFENNRQIVEYTDRDFSSDNLSIFLFLIKEGKAKFKQVNKISYVFKLKKWNFSVNNFNRMDHNSGWLIDYLEKNEDYQEIKKGKTSEIDRAENEIDTVIIKENELEITKTEEKEKFSKRKKSTNRRSNK